SAARVPRPLPGARWKKPLIRRRADRARGRRRRSMSGGTRAGSGFSSGVTGEATRPGPPGRSGASLHSQLRKLLLAEAGLGEDLPSVLAQPRRRPRRQGPIDERRPQLAQRSPLRVLEVEEEPPGLQLGI